MNRDEIVRKLKKIAADRLKIFLPANLSEEARLNEDLQIDSIMVLQLIVYIEEFFEVTVPEDEIDPATFRTFGTLVTFIEQLHRKEQLQ